MNKNIEGNHRTNYRLDDSDGIMVHHLNNNDQRKKQSVGINKSNPLELIRMNSLLDNEDRTPMHNNDSSRRNSEDDCENDTMNFDVTNRTCINQKHAEYLDNDLRHQNELSNLSPSSMEVDFSDPHEKDHSSFSRQQSQEVSKEVTTKSTIDKRSHHTGNNIQQDKTMKYISQYHFDDDDNDEEQICDDYVKSGTHFRSLLDIAFRRVATGVSDESQGYTNAYNRNTSGREDSSMNDSMDGFAISTTPSSGKKRELAQDSDISSHQRRRMDGRQKEKVTSQFAREKMAEVLSLKRMLKESEEHANALELANATLREASAASTARINTLTESIKITSAKVAEARADADMEKAKASSLGTQLKSLKCALAETKYTCESIKTEHDDIQCSARSLEAKLVHLETELNNEEKEKFDIKLERDTLRHSLEDQIAANKRIKATLENKEDELVRLKKNVAERSDLERARIERMNRVDNELRGVRSTLVGVTAAAKDAESANVDLQNTINTIQRENKVLHDKIEEIMDKSMREKSKLQEALAEVESEAQKLRMKAATDEEDLKRSNLDFMTSEKEVSQLRNRISALEARLKEMVPASGVLSPANENNNIEHMAIDSPLLPARYTSSSSSHTFANRLIKNTTNEEHKYSDKENRRSRPSSSDSSNNHGVIPSLRPITPKGLSYSQSENRITSNKNHRTTNNKASFGSIKGNPRSSNLSSVKCSICSKAAYGIMKSCQCDNPACNRRAHASCVATKNPPCSVSHPGTPAPQLPCILCKGK